jgi:hypothetical protein
MFDKLSDNPLVLIAGVLLGVYVGYRLIRWLFVVVVPESEYAILERLGKFTSVLDAGIHWKYPIIDHKAGKLSARLQQAHVHVEATTRDNVTVKLQVTIRHRISTDAEKIRQAFYGLLNPTDHLSTLTQNHVSRHIGTLDFSTVGPMAAEIASALKGELEAEAEANGYILQDVVVTSIDANAIVRDAGNRAEAARREKATQTALAEAETARRDAAAATVASMLGLFKSKGVESDDAVTLATSILQLEAVQIATQSDNTTIVVPAGAGATEAALASAVQRSRGRSWRD